MENDRKRPTRSLSDREKRLVQLIGEGRYSLARCMIMAGYKRSTSLTQGARVIRKPRVRKAIIEERVKRGLFCSHEELSFVEKSE